MTSELKKARRALAGLKRRERVLESASWGVLRDCDIAEARRMSRELARQIKWKELEIRDLAIKGMFISYNRGCKYTTVWRLPREYGSKPLHTVSGHNSYARAIAWAERQNR
jgi:hypothetical protein